MIRLMNITKNNDGKFEIMYMSPIQSDSIDGRYTASEVPRLKALMKVTMKNKLIKAKENKSRKSAILYESVFMVSEDS